jgi:SagB-type dehydrogenase family enzyme
MKKMHDIVLPIPKTDGASSFEADLCRRRSVREFSAAPLSLPMVGQLLWAAQGVTSSAGERTAPSAGALYPLELLLAAGRIDAVEPGVYRYRPQDHALRFHLAGDRRKRLSQAALQQSALADAAAILAIAAVYRRTSAEYGTRGKRYVQMEVGHAAQNVYLQAVSLGLGTVIIGAFDDDRIHEILELSGREAPLALLPVGVPR